VQTNLYPSPLLLLPLALELLKVLCLPLIGLAFRSGCRLRLLALPVDRGRF
jgi:hypothetical protein